MSRFSFSTIGPLTSGGTVRAYAVIDGPSQAYGSRVGRVLLDSVMGRWTFRLDDAQPNITSASDIAEIQTFIASLAVPSPDPIQLVP